MSVLELLSGALAQSDTSILFGQVSRFQPLPASFSDPLYVIIPDLDTNTFLTFADWPQMSGTSLPTAGAPCLLIVDNRSNMRLVWWGESTGIGPVGASSVPGDLIASAASSRVGSLLCDGTAYSRATYAALFTAIGTTYGAGDGSTTFNVPDLRGRSALGAGTGSGLTARSRGQTGGEEAHLLATAEMPSHNHGGTTGTGSTGSGTTGTGSATTSATSVAHTHTATGSGANNLLSFSGSGGTVAVTGGTNVSGLGNPNTGTMSANDPHSHTVSIPGLSVPSLSVAALAISSQGGGGTHNNMQPYGVVNWFIKT